MALMLVGHVLAALAAVLAAILVLRFGGLIHLHVLGVLRIGSRGSRRLSGQSGRDDESDHVCSPENRFGTSPSLRCASEGALPDPVEAREAAGLRRPARASRRSATVRRGQDRLREAPPSRPSCIRRTPAWHRGSVPGRDSAESAGSRHDVGQSRRERPTYRAAARGLPAASGASMRAPWPSPTPDAYSRSSPLSRLWTEAIRAPLSNPNTTDQQRP